MFHATWKSRSVASMYMVEVIAPDSKPITRTGRTRPECEAGLASLSRSLFRDRGGIEATRHAEETAQYVQNFSEERLEVLCATAHATSIGPGWCCSKEPSANGRHVLAFPAMTVEKETDPRLAVGKLSVAGSI